MLYVSRVWTPCQPVPELNQDPLSENSHWRCRRRGWYRSGHAPIRWWLGCLYRKIWINVCIRTVGETNLTPSLDQAQLGVVRCTLTQPEQPNYRRRTVTFQTCIKIENKSCKVIVDSDSCINVVASRSPWGWNRWSIQTSTRLHWSTLRP